MGMFGGMGGNILGGVINGIGNLGSTFLANQGWNAVIHTGEARLDDIRARKREALDHRNKLYYQDNTQTAENQAARTQAQQLLDENTQRLAAGKTVSGASDEALALQKANNAAVVGNMLQQQAIEGAHKKEQAYKDWQAQDNALENQIDAWERYKAETRKAKHLGMAQNFLNTANTAASTAVEVGNQIPM